MDSLLPDESIGTFADDNDRASALEMAFNDEAVSMARGKAAPETHPDFDGKHCIDCSELIPKVRRDMGRIRCVTCQDVLEKKQRLRYG